MNLIYFLASCDTCRKIIKSLPNANLLTYIDIRQNPITAPQLNQMYEFAGTYEALFSKKAQIGRAHV